MKWRWAIFQKKNLNSDVKDDPGSQKKKKKKRRRCKR